MNSRYKVVSVIFYVILILGLGELLFLASHEAHPSSTSQSLILSVEEYRDGHLSTIWEQLRHRVQMQPFNLAALVIFFLAICHTFFAHKLNVLAERLKKRNEALNKKRVDSFGVEMLRFMGETEVIFGIWVIPLIVTMLYYYDWTTAIHYLDQRDYTEPLFVVVVMALASTKPILKLAEECLKYIASFGGGTVTAWWLTILTVGPLFGSLITEPGAMTISALLLAKQFYRHKPSPKLAYATLGLLFTNISVGGVLTNFAAPPVLMVRSAWHWTTPDMLGLFGIKAVIGIIVATSVYYMLFRKELQRLVDTAQIDQLAHKEDKPHREEPIPFWITLTHVLFLAWCVVHAHYPVIFIGSFLLFLGFYRATYHYQSELELKGPILVGFFLAGLVVHGSLQGWWISPLLSSATDHVLVATSLVLTSFNDNAAITFLASLIPNFDDAAKYAVMTGAITGGGLTVIANAPNPAGQSLLSRFFDQGVSAGKLFCAAVIPTAIMLLSFYLVRLFY